MGLQILLLPQVTDLRHRGELYIDLEYPFASDLWASSTWQATYRNHEEYYENRKVEDYLYRAEFELFDLSVDPWEVKNLAASKKYAEVLEEMMGKLKAFQQKNLGLLCGIMMIACKAPELICNNN